MQSLYLTLLFLLHACAQQGPPPVPTILTYAPVPTTGYGPEIPRAEYRIESFGQGAYMITDSLYQCMFLTAGEGVILVDAPPSIGHNILNGIRTVTSFPISHVIYNNSHADHIGAAYLANGQDVTYIAQEETLHHLVRAGDPTRPLPNITFTDNYNVTVGNQTLQLSYKGNNHEPGNIFIYAPAQKILFLVDVIYPGWVPYHGLGEGQDIPGYIDAHDQTLEYDFDYFLGGHLNRWGTRDDVLIQKEYVMDLYNNCAQAIILSGDSSNPLYIYDVLKPVEAANPDNPWAANQYWEDQVTTFWCVNQTNQKWIGRLAGADVYGVSNANVMISSLKLDFGILGPLGVTD